MKFSIIVAVYNVEKYLKKCLDSLVGQTHKDLEIILIDDGSKDESLAICQAYAEKDQRIRVFHKENGGQSSARNLGLQHVTGDYILFVDSDDFIEKETCEIFAKELEKESYPEVLMARALNYLPDGSTRPKMTGDVWNEGGTGLAFWAENTKRHTLSSALVVHICKASLVKDAGIAFPEGRVHEDVHWAFQIYYYAKSAIYVPFDFYYHVMREGSTTHSANPKRCHDTLWVAKDIERIFKENPKEYEKEVMEYTCYLQSMAVHVALLQKMALRKVFSKEDRKNIINKLKTSKNKRYQILRLVLQFYLWGPYGICYRFARRKKVH